MNEEGRKLGREGGREGEGEREREGVEWESECTSSFRVLRSNTKHDTLVNVY